jgi:hypothetical protein
MSKVSTNISLDADLKKESQELYSDLGYGSFHCGDNIFKTVSCVFREFLSPSPEKILMQKRWLL